MAGEMILLVEDSEITLFKLKAVLTRLGYAVTSHSSAVAALDWLGKTEALPSLIISDVNMPGISGYEFVHRVKSAPATAHIPIMLLTSQVEVKDKIAGLQAGADEYVGKTVGPAELELRVKALLAKAASARGIPALGVAETVSVFSLRGGVGTSSVALNLAVALTQMWGIEVSLWDAAPSGGHGALMLNARPQASIGMLADWAEDTLDNEVLDKLLVKHESGIRLLPGCASFSETASLSPRIVDLIWPCLQARSLYIVVDAGNHFTDVNLQLLLRSDVILLLLAPDVASLKSTSDAYQAFETFGIERSKVVPVVNSIFPLHRLPLPKIAPLLHTASPVQIPYDSEAFVQAIQSGSPLAASAPRSAAWVSIAALAYQLSASKLEPTKAGYTSPLLETIRRLKGRG